jgi:hypothetical protein
VTPEERNILLEVLDVLQWLAYAEVDDYVHEEDVEIGYGYVDRIKAARKTLIGDD